MAKRAGNGKSAVKRVEKTGRSEIAHPNTGQLVWLCVAGWLIPGCGHFILGKKWRALILGSTIIVMFLFGLLMRGEFYAPQAGALLQSLGFLGEMCVGAAMPAASFFGYSGGGAPLPESGYNPLDPRSGPLFVSADYGTAFLVSAGMLNVLTILDAYDIAMGRKP